jgi:hypothetical protein
MCIHHQACRSTPQVLIDLHVAVLRLCRPSKARKYDIPSCADLLFGQQYDYMPAQVIENLLASSHPWRVEGWIAVSRFFSTRPLSSPYPATKLR